MATLVSLQLVRVAGVGDYHATSFSVSKPRSSVVLNSRLFQGSSLKISSQPGGALLQGVGSLCCPLWSHLMIPKSNSHSRAGLMPVSASSIGPIPYEQEIRRTAVILATYGAHLIRRTPNLLQLCPPLVAQVAPAMTLVAFTIWGLGPTIRLIRKNVFKRGDKKWDESRTYNIMASYMRPIFLWIGIILICRVFDPVVLSTEASQIIKQRFVNFVRSLSTVLAFAFCTASLTQQVQRFMMEHQDAEESRNLGVKFIGNTVYTSVWIAAVCLFMELLGFSTQKWITAGGFGTVLITLAGREIFTNFLSSIMIHATRPFVDNEWIQTKIEGQEVSGTVEHVGWWSPTVIRGDDREAVHIPNHKFSVSVVRNLSQKTHWRIKTHLGINHLDVNKMNPIVSDMRKVLAKHPQVEQQRLHRRVFFDNVDPENQALLILVSCFVKTSHFEEYLRVKEIILLDLLKVISHHNARLATPIRSVQRVLDESDGFRDMRNANQAQRRPFLLLDSRAVSTSDDEEDDSDTSGDISNNISQLAKATKAAPTKASEESGSESDGAPEDQSGLKPPSEIKKPKESITPVAAQQNTKGSSSEESALTGKSDDSDVHETLMDRINAGTEERLIQSDNGKATSEQPVATSHAPPTDLVVEIPEEKVPHLYSNNVGLDDVSDQAPEFAPPASSDDQARDSEKTAPSLKINISVHSDLTGKDDKHVGVHVGIGSTLPASTDDPWRRPSASERRESNVSDEVSSIDPWRQPSTTQGSNESVQASSSPSDNLWKQPSPSQVHNTQKTRPALDSNLVVPGVAIEGPKHSLPLDEDFITLDDSRTLVVSGKANSIKERRESSGTSDTSDTRDTRDTRHR